LEALPKFAPLLRMHLNVDRLLCGVQLTAELANLIVMSLGVRSSDFIYAAHDGITTMSAAM